MDHIGLKLDQKVLKIDSKGLKIALYSKITCLLADFFLSLGIGGASWVCGKKSAQ